MAADKYSIVFVSSAAGEFRELETSIQNRVSRVIDGLQQNPRPPGAVKLAGQEALWRIRVGDYRVVYKISDSEKLVRIMRIRHRREVYR